MAANPQVLYGSVNGNVWSVSDSVPSNNHYHRYTWLPFPATSEMKQLSAACRVTHVSMTVSCSTNATNGLDFYGAVQTPGTDENASPIMSGSAKVTKNDGNASPTFTQSGLDITNVFGANAGDWHGIVQITNSHGALTNKTYSISSVAIALTYTPGAYVRFYDSPQFGGAQVGLTQTCTNGSRPTYQVPPAHTGYRFVGWLQNTAVQQTGSILYTAHSTFPATGSTDVNYYACWESITYHINVETVNQSGASINAPTGQTGNQSFTIGQTMSCSAPSFDATDGDYVYDANTKYVFSYWSLHKSNGDTIVDTYSSRNYSLGVLTDSVIASWFIDSTNTVIARAHYQRVYDIALSITNLASQDPTNVGKDGVVSMTVTSGSTTQRFLQATILAGSAQIRVTNPDIQVDVELSSMSDYRIATYTATGTVYNTFTRTVNGNLHQCQYSLASSTSSFAVRVLKQYFTITLSNNTGNAVKVKRDGIILAPDSTSAGVQSWNLSREGKPITIDARLEATQDTKYNAVLSYNGENVSNNCYTINSLLQNYAFDVSTTVQTFNITTIIDDITVSESTVDRHGSATFTVAEEEAKTIISAALVMGNTTLKSIPNATEQYAESLEWTVPDITDHCVLTVTRETDPRGYVTIDVSHCAHGVVAIQDSVVRKLKSTFTPSSGITVTGVTVTDGEYEIVRATYEWSVRMDGSQDFSTIEIGLLNPNQSTTIVYPLNEGVPPGQADVILVIRVVFRKNTLYYSTHGAPSQSPLLPNHVYRTSSLYYTNQDAEQKQIVAVFAQDEQNQTPVLLYDDPRRVIYLNSDQDSTDASVYYGAQGVRLFKSSNAVLSQSQLIGATIVYTNRGTTSTLVVSPQCIRTGSAYNYNVFGVWQFNDGSFVVCSDDSNDIPLVWVRPTGVFLAAEVYATTESLEYMEYTGDYGKFRHDVSATEYIDADILAGTMVIHCSGDVTSQTAALWQQYAPYIRHVTIDDGCTSLPSGTFDTFTYLEDILIPSTMSTSGYPTVRISNDCLVITCLDSDDADDYTFEIDENERLVVTYGE